MRALLAVWICATGLAVARAATLWAALRGLSGRAVNSEGLLDAEAIRESVFAFSALAAGAAFYFLLRRCTAATRELAVRAALWGVTVSAAAAGFQKLRRDCQQALKVGQLPVDQHPQCLKGAGGGVELGAGGALEREVAGCADDLDQVLRRLDRV